MPRIVFGVTFLLFLFFFLSCGDSSEQLNDRTITEYFTKRDSLEYINCINNQHSFVRRQISIRLNSLLSARTDQDTTVLDSLTEELGWLISKYDKEKAIKDLSLKFSLYSDWILPDVRNKKEYDTEYDKLKKRKSSLSGFSYRQELNGLYPDYVQINDSFKLAEVNYDLANSFYEDKEIDSAINYLSVCKNICLELDDYYQLGNCELLTAKVNNIYQADYFSAEKSYINAITSYQKINADFEIPYALQFQGFYYLQLYQTERAINYFIKASDLFEKYGNNRMLSFSKYYLAEAYYDKGMPDSARLYAEESLELSKNMASGNQRYLTIVANSESCLGLINQYQGKYKKAREKYAVADTIFKSSSDIDGTYMNKIRLASLYLDEKNYEAASEIYLKILRESDKFEETITSLYGLGICEYSLGNITKAIPYLKTCVELSDDARRKLPVPEVKTGMLSDKIGFYNLLSVIFLNDYLKSKSRSTLDSAIIYLEKSKAGALIDQLASDNNSPENEDRILKTISHFQKEILLGAENPLKTKKHIRKLEDTLILLRYNNPNRNGFDGINTIDSINISSIQENILNKNTALAEYVISDFGSYLILITKNSCFVEKLNIDTDSLGRLVNGYLSVISKYPTESNLETDYSIFGKKLYEVLFPRNILDSINTEELIVIPSGSIMNLPFDVLIDESLYLIDKYYLSYAPSSTTFMILKNNYSSSSQSSKIIAFGDPQFPEKNIEPEISDNKESLKYSLLDEWNIRPLPYSSIEINYIADIFGKSSMELYESKYASETNFKQIEFNKFRFIHLATHGIVDYRNPERSAILFSMKDNLDNDGLLQPIEIRKLDIDVDFIFLSACATGSGKIAPGEGILNLARPFLIAGCNAAIVTHWNINDRCSAEFAKSFYQAIKEGWSKSEALTKAKRQLLHSQRKLYHHPYFWASYSLVGI